MPNSCLHHLFIITDSYFRYQCRDCGKKFRIKTGVLLTGMDSALAQAFGLRVRKIAELIESELESDRNASKGVYRAQ